MQIKIRPNSSINYSQSQASQHRVLLPAEHYRQWSGRKFSHKNKLEVDRLKGVPIVGASALQANVSIRATPTHASPVLTNPFSIVQEKYEERRINEQNMFKVASKVAEVERQYMYSSAPNSPTNSFKRYQNRSPYENYDDEDNKFHNLQQIQLNNKQKQPQVQDLSSFSPAHGVQMYKLEQNYMVLSPNQSPAKGTFVATTVASNQPSVQGNQADNKLQNDQKNTTTVEEKEKLQQAFLSQQANFFQPEKLFDKQASALHNKNHLVTENFELDSRGAADFFFKTQSKLTATRSRPVIKNYSYYRLQQRCLKEYNGLVRKSSSASQLPPNATVPRQEPTNKVQSKPQSFHDKYPLQSDLNQAFRRQMHQKLQTRQDDNFSIRPSQSLQLKKIHLVLESVSRGQPNGPKNSIHAYKKNKNVYQPLKINPKFQSLQNQPWRIESPQSGYNVKMLVKQFKDSVFMQEQRL